MKNTKTKTKKTKWSEKTDKQKKIDLENLKTEIRKGVAKMKDGIDSLEEMNDMWMSESRNLMSGYYGINRAIQQLDQTHVWDGEWDDMPDEILEVATHMNAYQGDQHENRLPIFGPRKNNYENTNNINGGNA